MWGWFMGRPVDLEGEVGSLVGEVVEELPDLLPAIAGAWFKANDNILVFNTTPIVCVRGPNRGEVRGVNAGVATACVVFCIVD